MVRAARWRFIGPLFLVLAGYALAVAFLDPFYEYPVGDDWVYAQSARALWQEGRLVIPDPSIASLVFQTVWSYPFMALGGGFSFTALHWATITLFVLAVIAWYFLLSELGFGRWLCGFGTALLVFNPFVLPLSVTFQTDVPSLALAIGATYGYAAWLRTDRVGPLLAGTMLSVCAILVRQSAMVIPTAALAVALGLALVGARRLSAWKAALAVLPPAGALVGLYAWVSLVHGVPLVWKFRSLDIMNLDRILEEALYDPWVTLHYLAFLTLPAVVVLAASRASLRRLRESRRFPLGVLAACLAVLAPTVWAAATTGATMPYFTGDDFLWREFIDAPWTLVTVVTALGGGVILALAVGAAWRLAARATVEARAAGVAGRWRQAAGWTGGVLAVVVVVLAFRIGEGPLVRAGESFVAYVWETKGAIGGAHTFPRDYWTSKVSRAYERLRLAVLLGGGVAVVALVAGNRLLRLPAERPPGGPSAPGRALVGVIGVLSFTFFVMTGLVFGRYLVPLVPAAIVLLLAALARVGGGSRALGTAVLGLWAIFSTLNGDAVIQFHGAAWRAHQGLLAQGLPPRDIDPGTFTLMGWYMDVDRYRLMGRVPRWWVEGELYRLRPAFQLHEPLDRGYDVVRAVPYRNVLVRGESAVVVLKKRGT